MKILRLKIAGFGPLRGEWSFAPDRMNLVVDDNERGKTSMIAAIAAALYGLEDDRRSHRVLTPLERWKPWSGGGYGVELEVETAGGRLRIVRDFANGSVAVFGGDGREITATFLDERDAYPVGQKVLGLDAAEFEKCALLRQGELDGVVPGDERARRGSTLRARLENAADTHVGDTNASEAMRVLDESLRRYHAAELDFTGTVDNAIERLETKAGMEATDLAALDHEFARAQEPLETLAQLSDEEQALKEALKRLDDERRAGLASELGRQLDENEQLRTDLVKLEQEAAELEYVARLPHNAEGELREAVARFEEAQRHRDELDSKRREETGRERLTIESELAGLGALRDFGEEQADQCVTLAAELRRLAYEEGEQRRRVLEMRDQLAALGYAPERIQSLTARFAPLPETQQRLLRQQGDTALEYQTGVARLEQERTAASEVLRRIDASRSGRRVPGWIALTLGLGGAIAGAALMVMRGGPMPGVAVLGGGGALALLGAVLLGAGARALATEHDAAMERLENAQRRLNALRAQRAADDAEIADLARHMAFRDAEELKAAWSEYMRMLDDSGPLLRAQEQLARYDDQRRLVLDRSRALLRLLGDAPPAPEALEKLAYEGRRAMALRASLAELERGWEWYEETRHAEEAVIAGLRERAVRILQSAGLTFDPERPWADHIADLAVRAGQRARRTVVVEELIPYAKQRLLPAAEVAQRRRQLEQLGGAASEAPARPTVEIDLEAKRTRLRLEEVQHARGDLRVQVEDVWRRHSQLRPEYEAKVARYTAAAARARAFKQAVELARGSIAQVAIDTHRRWAEFLNDRVAELLRGFGAGIEQLRFGEDLDFSIQFEGGRQVSRGKAHLQLSAGARDQLYLAVRLAVSEYLSRGAESLPLLIDDAFATSDDGRLAAGMRALVEGYGAGHQVIVVTCHRGRHEDLRRMDPELFRERVCWLEVSPRAAEPPKGGSPR